MQVEVLQAWRESPRARAERRGKIRDEAGFVMGRGTKVVVITGGSSGLGRETAVQFAGRGWFVVVAARRAAELEETLRLCRDAGGEGIAVAVDVNRPEDLDRLVDQTVQARGGIDVWVNNAGVTLFAGLDGASFAEHRAVIETNLVGALAASRAVLPVFKRQRRGTMINVGSVLSHVAQPFVPAYVASKFGLRGLSEALRAQFADEPGIRICSVYPFSIDTPHFESGANAMKHRARAIPPVQSPEKVARAIVGLAERPRRQVFVPGPIVLGLAAHWLFPRTTERLLLHALRRWHFDDVEAAPSQGSLFAPRRGKARIHGRRRPQLGRTRFGAWVAGDLVKTQLVSLRERLTGRTRNVGD